MWIIKIVKRKILKLEIWICSANECCYMYKLPSHRCSSAKKEVEFLFFFKKKTTWERFNYSDRGKNCFLAVFIAHTNRSCIPFKSNENAKKSEFIDGERVGEKERKKRPHTHTHNCASRKKDFFSSGSRYIFAIQFKVWFFVHQPLPFALLLLLLLLAAAVDGATCDKFDFSFSFIFF